MGFSAIKHLIIKTAYVNKKKYMKNKLKKQTTKRCAGVRFVCVVI